MTTSAMAGILAAYFAGYLLIMASPGPNMLMTGSLAAMNGFRAVLPLAIGLGLGISLQGSAIYALAGLFPESGSLEAVGYGVAACLLAALGLRIASSDLPADGCASPIRGTRALLVTGLTTAAANPLTGTYFAAEFLGPLNDLPGPLIGLALALTALLSVLEATIVAALLSQSAVRRRVLTVFRPLARIIGAIFIGLAALKLRAAVLLL